MDPKRLNLTGSGRLAGPIQTPLATFDRVVKSPQYHYSIRVQYRIDTLTSVDIEANLSDDLTLSATDRNR